MMQRDTLTRSNTINPHKLTSRFDSNGDMTVRFTPPETARSEKPRQGTEKRKSSLKVFSTRSKVTDIEVSKCKGKVGLSFLRKTSRPSTQPNSANLSRLKLRTEPPSGARSPVLTMTYSGTVTPRSLQSLSPREGYNSMETSVTNSPRLWTPVDPRVQELFVSDQPRRPKGKTITKHLIKPKKALVRQSVGTESDTSSRDLVSVLSEFVHIQTSETKLLRRVGVRNIARNEEKTENSVRLGLSKLIQEKEKEEGPVYMPKRRISALKRLNNILGLTKIEKTSSSRAEQKWQWTGGLGKHTESSGSLLD